MANLHTTVAQDALASVEAALEEMEEKNFHLQNKVEVLESKLEDAGIHNDKLLEDIAQLNDYVQELEIALSEAYLTSSDDGPGDTNVNANDS